MNSIFQVSMILSMTVFLLLIETGYAQQQATEPSASKTAIPIVDQQANKIMAAIGTASGKMALRKHEFSASFLKAVPMERFWAICSFYQGNYGKPIMLKKLSGGQHKAAFRLQTATGYRYQLSLTLDPKPPHLITGLFLSQAALPYQSFDEARKEADKLKGQTGLLVMMLDEKQTVLAELNADKPLAIGSAFKLYVLGELVSRVNRGEAKWSDVVTLSPQGRSLPSGRLQDWPFGSPMTLQSLATLMISISDNTATDQLIASLGRASIEKTLVEMGNKHLKMNSPFLKTSEMFRLKGGRLDGKPAADVWLKTDDLNARQKLLKRLETIPLKSLSLYPDGMPSHIGTIEWFASSRELAHALNWLKRQTEKDAAARGLLAVNPGMTSLKKDPRWHYVGYKGGSEPGVLNMSYLLKRDDGKWFAVVLTSNNQLMPLKAKPFEQVLMNTIELCAAYQPSEDKKQETEN